VFRKTRSGVCLEPILKEAWSQGYPETAICVQRFDDSLNSAIRITYRISLRSSSLREPRYPLHTVVLFYVLLTAFQPHEIIQSGFCYDRLIVSILQVNIVKQKGISQPGLVSLNTE
jgi:hypothetical protein